MNDPSHPSGGRPSAPAHRPDHRASSPVPYDGEVETQRIVTIFGSNSRAGYWEPPERLEVVSLFGGVQLDFRDANLYSGVSVVNCLAIFGGIEIIVPPDLQVETSGTGVFGGFEHKVKDKRRRLFDRFRRDDDPLPDHDPDAEPPVLEIGGLALFGGVTIRR